MTHICVSNLTITGSDNGLLPGRRQAIIWTNAGILLIGPYGTNFSEILIEILTYSFTKMSLKVSSVLSTFFGAVTSTGGATLKDLSKWVSITHKGQRAFCIRSRTKETRTHISWDILSSSLWLMYSDTTKPHLRMAGNYNDVAWVWCISEHNSIAFQNDLFGLKTKESSNLGITNLAVNALVTGGFPAQKASIYAMTSPYI